MGGRDYGMFVYLVDSRRDFGEGKDFFKLSGGEVRDTNGFGEPQMLTLFHGTPNCLGINEKYLFFRDRKPTHLFAEL